MDPFVDKSNNMSTGPSLSLKPGNIKRNRTASNNVPENSRLVHQPVRLKLYSAVFAQNRCENLSDTFHAYKPKTLNEDFEDKTLLKELFNWTNDAAMLNELEFEIIVADKFSAGDSIKHTHMAKADDNKSNAKDSMRSKQLSFDELLKTRYEDYKQNYDKKTRIHNNRTCDGCLLTKYRGYLPNTKPSKSRNKHISIENEPIGEMKDLATIKRIDVKERKQLSTTKNLLRNIFFDKENHAQKIDSAPLDHRKHNYSRVTYQKQLYNNIESKSALRT